MIPIGTFALVLNDGSLDKMINMKSLLTERIEQIKRDRRLAGFEDESDILPTIADIELTHTIVPRNSYKPYVPVTSQYLRVVKPKGQLKWGGSITFDLPNEGDFMWDAFLHLRTNEITASESEDITYSGVPDGVPVRLINGQGQTVTQNGGFRNYVFYANNLAHRLFTHHDFKIQDSSVDKYDPVADTFYMNMRVPLQKLAAYKRCIGQEIPMNAYAQTVNFPASGAGGDIPCAREVAEILNGPQTPQYSQPPLSLVYPYKFDFCEAPSASIPILQIPGSKRQITTRIARADQCIFTVSPYLVEYTTPGGAAVDDVYTTGLFYAKTTVVGSVVTNPDSFWRSVSMYVNMIYIDPLIQDLYVNQSIFSIVRKHVQYSHAVRDDLQMIQLSTFHLGLEYMFCGVQWANLTPSTVMEKVNTKPYALAWDTFVYPRAAGYTTSPGWTAQVSAGPEFARIGLNESSPLDPYYYFHNLQYTTNMQFTFQTFPIDNTDPEGFPNIICDAYVPYRIGRFNISPNTSHSGEGSGIYMINFSFAPGSRTPAGYINISRGQEVFMIPSLNAEIPQDVKMRFVATGISLDFFYIAVGSINLRFT